MNIQDWFPLGLFGLISLQFRGLSRVFNTTVQKPSILRHSAFFMVQTTHPYMTTGKTIALTRRTFVGKVMSLLFNMLSSPLTCVSMCIFLHKNTQRETDVEADALLIPKTLSLGFLSYTIVIPNNNNQTGILKISEDAWSSASSFSMAHLIERWCGYCFSFRKVEFIALPSLETSHSLQIWNTQSKRDKLSPVKYP